MAYPPYPPADPNGQPSYPQQQPPASQPYYPPYQPAYPPSPAGSAAPPSQPYYPYPQPAAAPPSQPYYQQPPTGYPYYQQPSLATPRKPKWSPLLILLAVVVLVAIAGGGWYFLSHRTANIAGTWDITVTTTSPSARVEDDHLNIQQNGDQLTVVITAASNASASLNMTGHVSGSDIEFDYTFQGCSLRMPGTVSDSNHMAGSFTVECGGDVSGNESGTWNATRIGS